MRRWPKLAWFDLADEAERAQARAACHGRPGVYFLRVKGKTRVHYIGSSEPGAVQRRKAPDPRRLWKTIQRHFQACRSRGRPYSFGDDNFCTGERERYELALLLTKSGAEARAVEEAAIAHWQPVDNAAREPAATDDEVPF